MTDFEADSVEDAYWDNLAEQGLAKADHEFDEGLDEDAGDWDDVADAQELMTQAQDDYKFLESAVRELLNEDLDGVEVTA